MRPAACVCICVCVQFLSFSYTIPPPLPTTHHPPPSTLTHNLCREQGLMSCPFPSPCVSLRYSFIVAPAYVTLCESPDSRSNDSSVSLELSVRAGKRELSPTGLLLRYSTLQTAQPARDPCDPMRGYLTRAGGGWSTRTRTSPVWGTSTYIYGRSNRVHSCVLTGSWL